MPVIYKSFQSVLANKEGKKLFYPRVVLTGNVDTEQVAKEIAECLPSLRVTRRMSSTTW